MIATYESIMNRIKVTGLSVIKYIMDNEVSKNYKAGINNNDAERELVPFGKHSQYIVERSIQTFKTIPLALFWVCVTPFQCTCDADYSHKRSTNLTSSDSQ